MFETTLAETRHYLSQLWAIALLAKLKQSLVPTLWNKISLFLAIAIGAKLQPPFCNYIREHLYVQIEVKGRY